ncbi:MAG: hypothetical protein AAB766_04670 [Patescibacteria group bacterium]
MKIALIRFRPKDTNSRDQSFQDYIRKLQNREETLRRQIGQLVLPHEADVILNVSGDGPMTETVKEYAHLNKPFYGDNFGTYGFLLNDHTPEENIVEAIERAVWIEFPMLDVTIEYLDGTTEKTLAFNDVWTKTLSTQTAKHRVFVNGKNIVPQVFPDRETFGLGDAVIVCTAGGSTAYNRSAGGKVFSPDKHLIGITFASPSPIKIPALQVSDKSEIVVELIEDEKRNYLVVADNVAFERVKQVVIRKSDITAKIGFKPGFTHQEKIKKMLKYYQKLNGNKRDKPRKTVRGKRDKQDEQDK